MFVSGGSLGQLGRFTNLAYEAVGALQVDASELYMRLADRVEAALGESRVFSAAMVPILMSAIKEIGDELGIREIAALKLDASPILPTYRDTLCHVRQVVRDAVGDDLARLYLSREIAKVALEEKVDEKVIPIEVVGASQSEIAGLAGLFGAGFHQVVLGDQEVTLDHVKDVFKEAVKKMARSTKVVASQAKVQKKVENEAKVPAKVASTEDNNQANMEKTNG